MSQQVSVVIANWNGRRWLEHCLPALFAQTYRHFEVIIVDNASTDNSVEWVNRHYPAVRQIRNRRNLGFAGANNIGIRAAAGELIATLNNDTRPDPNWLAELVKGISVAPDVGMAASKIVLWERPGILDSAGIAVDWAGFGWNRGWGRPAASAPAPQEVFGPSAAAALYRRDMLAGIGLFDEDFFAYYEDVDLAWRAQRAGWNCRYIPTAVVLHQHSATGGQARRLKTFLLNRNKLWTLFKNYHPLDLLWAWPLILGLDALSAGVQLWRTRSLAPLSARRQALAGWRRMAAKRRPAVRRVALARPRVIPGRFR
ncbi:MAG: glycosyltransferase family 2 protein [Anaerolineae bacterium]